MSEDFDSPSRVAINRVYTRKGDKGLTSLVGGQKVRKDNLRIESYGTVDELNSHVGAARFEALTLDALAPLADALLRVQHQLFNLGSLMSTLPDDVHEKQPRPRQGDIDWLEAEMDRCNADLEPLRSFVLPGGSRLNTDLHVCRTVCRRAERLAVHLADEAELDPLAVQYLNRLSDAFFVWSRWCVEVGPGDEQLWEPNKA